MGNILLLTGWLLACSAMDLRSRTVPAWMLVLGGILCVPAAIGQWGECLVALKGGLPGALLFLVALATRKVGYGDGIVLACAGIALGGGRGALLFGLSLFLLSLCALVLLAFRKVRRDTGMPYLPFLTAAWFLVIASEKL